MCISFNRNKNNHPDSIKSVNLYSVVSLYSNKNIHLLFYFLLSLKNTFFRLSQFLAELYVFLLYFYFLQYSKYSKWTQAKSKLHQKNIWSSLIRIKYNYSQIIQISFEEDSCLIFRIFNSNCWKMTKHLYN